MSHPIPTQDPMDEICVCGDRAEYHIDGCEQCAVVDCGCKGFEPRDDIEKMEEVFLDAHPLS